MDTLTEYEKVGLRAQSNLADGHAYHQLVIDYADIVENLPATWDETQTVNVTEAEQRYKKAFGNLIGVDIEAYGRGARICPTSSNSIDMVACYLQEHAKRVLLIEPTFDNLYLLLKRRGCSVQSLPETQFHFANTQASVSAILNAFDFDTLFLVNPNNPTGRVLDDGELTAIAEYCAANGKILVLDTTFRLYARKIARDYDILQDAGCRYIIIEDTGKTWPTHDMKASLVACSAPDKAGLDVLYEEIYLCHSRFALMVFEQLFDRTREVGVEPCIHAPVEQRVNLMKRALSGTKIAMTTNREASAMPVEMLDVAAYGMIDHEALNLLSSRGVAVLPGSHFYWSRTTVPTHQFRVSMSRPIDVFQAGISVLGTVFESYGAGQGLLEDAV